MQECSVTTKRHVTLVTCSVIIASLAVPVLAALEHTGICHSNSKSSVEAGQTGLMLDTIFVDTSVSTSGYFSPDHWSLWWPKNYQLVRPTNKFSVPKLPARRPHCCRARVPMTFLFILNKVFVLFFLKPCEYLLLYYVYLRKMFLIRLFRLYWMTLSIEWKQWKSDRI